MIRKILSKRGFIITYEAIAIVIAFVGIFYVGYMAYTHNFLTFHEEKRNVEEIHYANLLADKILKDVEFPSNNYVTDYLIFAKRVSEKYFGGEKAKGTFDPFNTLKTNSTYTAFWEYKFTIENPYNEDFTNVQIPLLLTPADFNFDFSPDGRGISFWTAPGNNNGTEIPFWIEKWEYNKEAIVWVKVDLPKKSNVTIYMKRNQNGNPNIENSSRAVFLFFDDFERSNFNNGNWNTTGLGVWDITYDDYLKSRVAHLVSENNESVNFKDWEYKIPHAVSTTEINASSYIIEARAKGYTTGQGDVPDIAVGFFSNENSTHCYVFWMGYYQIEALCHPKLWRRYYILTLDKTANYFIKKNVWYNVRIEVNTTNKMAKMKAWPLDLNNLANNYDIDDSKVKWQITYNCRRYEGNYIIIGSGQGTNNEEYWFDDIKVRKNIPGITNKFYMPVEEFSQQYSTSKYTNNHILIPQNLKIVSNVNTTFVNYPYKIRDNDNIYIRTENLLVPVKTWRYANEKSIIENLTSGERLYFAVRRPSKLVSITAYSNTTTDVLFLVNGVTFNLTLDQTPKITGFGKVISTHSWEYYEPNEIRILNVSNNGIVYLNITYDQPSTIYVAKFRPYNISIILEPGRNLGD